MSAYAIWIVSPPKYTPSHSFDEVALGLRAAFRVLGHDVPIVREPVHAAGTTIVLGCHLLPKLRVPQGRDLILFNLEQITSDSSWITEDYFALLKRYPVWDYSEQNIAALRQRGIDARHCGIGYVPELTRIAPASEDVDVLFVGWVNKRRHAILHDIGGKGARVLALRQLYGKQRDDYIARSKIVLNVHYYEARVLEIVRVSYLLANRKCVVSETGLDRALEDPLRSGIAFASYEHLAATCWELLQNDARRAALAQAGFACMSALSQVDYLRRALKD